MRVTLVGLQGSGKSTLFGLLTEGGGGEGVAHHPLARVATVHVLDPRLERLAALHPGKKHTQAALEFADLPPFSGAGKEQQEESGVIAFAREADALVKVIRAFENPAIPHYAGSVNPARDLGELNSELLLADLSIVEKRVEKLEHSSRKPTRTQKEDKEELDALRPCLAALEGGKSIRDVALTAFQQKLLRGFRFLSEKPSLVLLNLGDDQVGDEKTASALACEEEVLPVALELELELVQLEAEERKQFMSDYGLESLSKERIIASVLRALGVITFYTVVGEEVRAWLLPEGATALDAAGRVHTDIARGFIRAEVVSFNDLVQSQSMKEVKHHGKLRLEGRDYKVQDGDILNVRFNV